MAGEFEKLMHDKMVQASIKDVMPLFDKDETWAVLLPKLQKKNTRSILYYLPYAAMLIMGVVIAILFIRPSETHNVTIVNDTHPAQQINQQVIIATTPDTITSKTNTIVKKTPQFRKHTNPSLLPVAPTIAQAPVTEQATQKETTQQPTPQPIVKVPKQWVRTVHLLDINNEDKGLVIKDTKPIPNTPGHVISSIVFGNTSGNRESNTPTINYKNILKN